MDNEIRCLQGGVKVPTGGKAREPLWHDPVRFRSRQYSLDGRRCGFAQIRPVMPVLGLTGRFFVKFHSHVWQGASLTLPERNTMTAQTKNTRKLAGTAMLSAVGFILMFIELSVPIMPAFIKLDFSELPVMLCGFYLGPAAAVACEAVKIFLKLLMKVRKPLTRCLMAIVN